MRRSSLIAQVTLLGVLGLLAFPSNGSALAGGRTIVLTANGPSPVDATIAGAEYPIWSNQDTTPHTVTFGDGCSFEVAPSSQAVGNCRDSWSDIGRHPYTVDTTVQASVTRVPSSRRVTITSKRHGFRLGSNVLLHGTLEAHYAGAPPSSFGPRMHVSVFARHHRNEPWYLVAVVMAKPLKNPHFGDPHSVWHLWVHPRTHTTYRAVAGSEPKTWEKAFSRPFGFYVRHR